MAIPRFLPEEYFAQRLDAYGVFVDRFGTIRRQFNVEVKGTRTSDGFILDEDFLYDDGEFWYFMDPNTFEQFQADINVIGECAKWLSEQDSCVVTLFNGNPLLVTPPNHVELEIVETDPGLRGDTAQGLSLIHI